MKIAQSNIINSIDIGDLIADLEKKYRNIFWTIFENDIYIYKPIGRRDFKYIALNENLSVEDKKDEIIKKCIIYPDDFNIDDCIAGLIDILYSKIIEISYLDSQDSMSKVIEYYRQDMYNMDNQITCLINEAFPNFDIEEIENWDLEKTAKYLSRAEYKLQNFRGFEFNEAYFRETSNSIEEEQDNNLEDINNNEEDKNINNEAKIKSKKEKLTPEKLRQLQQQFPEIDWGNDSGNGGIDAMGESIDTLAPALRPGMF